MSKEKKIQLRVFIQIFFVMGFAALYSWGGIEMKWLRRFIAPMLLCGGMAIIEGSYKPFIQAPFMMVSLCLGYGGNLFWEKVIRRFLFGSAIGLTSSIYMGVKRQWFLVITQLVLCIGLYIAIGVFNPFPSARAEETFLGIMIALIPMLSLKGEE